MTFIRVFLEFNAESSRSHTILQLFIQIEDSDEHGVTVLKRSVLSLVDLAGSEKWRPSLSLAGNSNADVQRELTNINTSLHVLGTCVAALLEPGRKHIPYRNSVLTRLLQDSLGGSGRTVLIATVRRDEDFLEETNSTLQFASRASRIRTVVVPSVVVSDVATLEHARNHIQELRSRIKQNEEIAHAESLSSSSRLIELEKRIQQLEAENASLRKLVDPLLLSKVNNYTDNVRYPIFI